MMDKVISFLEDYGWFSLIAIVVVLYVYNKFFKSKLKDYQQRRDEQEYAAKYHKNPDLHQARIQAQNEHIEKLQEKYNREVEEYKRKQEEKDAKRREELLKNTDGGRRLGNGKDDEKPKLFKPDYNPLMGAGSSYTYRPPKRSGCGGGGCGK